MRAKACLLAALLATAAAGAGCSEYHYYDIAVRFNTAPPMNFNGSSDVSTVQTCVLEVSGADSFEYTFSREQRCPPLSAGGSPLTDMGTFEYSSTADSGTLTFTFRAYVGPALQECQVGEGTTSVNVGATTVTGMLLVNRINSITSCQ
jgi:hypothetical protein